MREKVITRTIISTVGRVLCADNESGEVFERDFTISKKFASDAAIIKFLSKIYEKNIVIIRVIESDTVINLYECTETDFIAVSKLIKTESATKPEN